MYLNISVVMSFEVEVILLRKYYLINISTSKTNKKKKE